KRPDAVCRLICFSWAGGGTSQLAQWGRLFNDSIEGLSFLWLPGRETCLHEPFAKDMTSVVNEVTSVLLKEFKEKPFAFFGHRETASYCSFDNLALLLYLYFTFLLLSDHVKFSFFFLIFSSPYVLYNLTPEICYVLEKNRKPFLYVEANSKYRYLLECFMITFYVHRFEKTEMNIPFFCDITYFCGSDDKIHGAKGWQELTTGDASFYELPGDHFYLLKAANESFLIKHITRSIQNA
ncbi:SAST synthase, partial [Irena cyanogastra]|nr:SAST synthase [Irena cyanogastra]